MIDKPGDTVVTFGTGSNTELTRKYERVKVQNDIRMSKHIIGERDTYRGDTIENRGCLFIGERT